MAGLPSDPLPVLFPVAGRLRGPGPGVCLCRWLAAGSVAESRFETPRFLARLFIRFKRRAAFAVDCVKRCAAFAVKRDGATIEIFVEGLCAHPICSKLS